MSGRSWNRGTPVRIALEDGSVVKGQVWEEGEDGRVWVALEDGRYASVVTASGAAQLCDGLGRPASMVGKVAA